MKNMSSRILLAVWVMGLAWAGNIHAGECCAKSVEKVRAGLACKKCLYAEGAPDCCIEQVRKIPNKERAGCQKCNPPKEGSAEGAEKSGDGAEKKQ